MFYDERIQMELGKAFRATMILAWFISMIYGLLHILAMLSAGVFSVAAIVFELICLVSGLILLLYGEITYLASGKDEMLAHKKHLYYKKAFYLYLGIILLAFYLQIGLGSSSEWFTPNHFLLTLQMPCWLLLLTCLKYNGVPFNYSYLAEDKQTYICRTLENVVKLAKIVALATGAGLVVSIALVPSVSQIVAVLAAGIISWASLSIEYLIISWAERVSDQANERNRISIATLIFVCCGTVMYLISAAIGSYAAWNNGNNITNGITAMIVSTLIRSFEHLSMYFFGLFTVYLYSEMKWIKSKLFDVATVAAMGLVMFEFILDPLSQVVNYLVDGMSVKVILTTLYTLTAIDYLILIMQSAVLVTAAAAVVKKKAYNRTAYIYSIIVMLSSVCIHLWAMKSNTGQLAEYVIFSILAIWLCAIIAFAYRASKKC